MRRSLLAALATLLTFATVSIASPPAHAANGTLRIGNVILFDSCDDYDYRYSFAIPSYAEDWSAEVSVLGRDGNEAASDYLFGGAASGASELFLCGETPGVYTWSAEVTWYDYDYNESVFTVQGESFRLSYPRSRTGVRGTGGRRHVLNATVTDQRPRGYFRTVDAWVVLQRKAGARWVNVNRTLTSSRGTARWSVPNRPGRQRYRVVTPQQSYPYIQRSISRTVTLG